MRVAATTWPALLLAATCVVAVASMLVSAAAEETLATADLDAEGNAQVHRGIAALKQAGQRLEEYKKTAEMRARTAAKFDRKRREGVARAVADGTDPDAAERAYRPDSEDVLRLKYEAFLKPEALFARAEPAVEVSVVEADSAPGLRDFDEYFLQPNTPVLVKGGAASWPATGKWTSSYLASKLEGWPVNAEISANARFGPAETRWRGVERIPYKVVLSRVSARGADEGADATEAGGKEGAGKAFDVSTVVDEELPAPGAPPVKVSTDIRTSLAEDVTVPDRYVPNVDALMYRAVVSQAIGAQTHLAANKPVDQLIGVVMGSMKVTLFDGVHGRNLYEARTANKVAAVDIEHPNLDKFPRFKASASAGLTVHVEQGDLLFVPALWFAQYETLDAVTTSVSLQFDRHFAVRKFNENMGEGFASREVLSVLMRWDADMETAARDSAATMRGDDDRDSRLLSDLTQCASVSSGDKRGSVCRFTASLARDAVPQRNRPGAPLPPGMDQASMARFKKMVEAGEIPKGKEKEAMAKFVKMNEMRARKAGKATKGVATTDADKFKAMSDEQKLQWKEAKQRERRRMENPRKFAEEEKLRQKKRNPFKSNVEGLPSRVRNAGDIDEATQERLAGERAARVKEQMEQRQADNAQDAENAFDTLDETTGRI